MKELHGRLLLLALALIVAPWLAFVWEASTGLTLASRRSLGQISTPEHLASTRRMATGFTIFLAPVAAWCVLAGRK